MILARFLAVLLVVGASISALMAVVSKSDIVDHTISHGLSIERQFREAEGFVDAFVAERGRLPSSSEFKDLAPDGSNKIELYPNGLTDIDFDCPRQFTELSEGDYVLTIWRGEWMECYRPSLNWSTVTTKRSELFLFRKSWIDRLAYFFLAAVLAGSAIWVWKRHSQRSCMHN